MVLTGDADPQVTDDEARAWRSHAAGAFELLRHPGGHVFLNEHAGPAISEISGRLPL